MKIRSFFNLGLTFSVSGDQLKVEGFKQFPPDERPGLAEMIRQNKAGIMAEVKRLQDQLKELVAMADKSKDMAPEAVDMISDDGSKIIDLLTPEMVRQIFNQSSEKEMKR